jgi:hypothetical protein
MERFEIHSSGMNSGSDDSAEPPQPGSPLSADLKRAEVVDEARRLVLLGIKAEQPARRSQRELFQWADQMLLAISRYSRGEITLEQCQSVFDEITAKLPRRFPLKPAWLPPDLGTALVHRIRGAKRQYPDAIDEQMKWLRREFSKPLGAPVSKDLGAIYRRAAIMHKGGASWLGIARELCPLKVADGTHKCDKQDECGRKGIPVARARLICWHPFPNPI